MTRAIRIWAIGILIALASIGSQAAWAAEAIAPGGPGAAPSTPPGLLGKPQGAWAKADGALRGLVAEFAAHRARGAPDEFRPSNTTLQFSLGRVVVDIVATEDPEALLDQLQRMGLQSASRYGNVISGKLPVGAIARAVELQNLQAISAAHQPLTNAGIPESEGVQAMYADAVHGNGITGVGAVIGVLSDSFDHRDGYADGQASGNLPPGILVLDDSANNGSGLNDEGRGMMELAYDVAPGANFAFHTAFGGQADFANGIVELADAGANIIVDDVIYFAEPMFQDGVIAQAVDEVVSRGVPYFSSAGNFARMSYEADYVSSGEPWYVQDPFAGQQYRGVLHDFDPGPGIDWHQDLQIPDYTSHRILSLVVQWDQPFASLSSGSTGAEVDLDVYLTDTADPSNLLASSVDNNAQHNGGTGEPIELLQFQVGGCDSFLELFNGIGCVPDPGTFRLQIAYYDGGGSAVPGADPIEPTRLKYVLFDRNIGLQHATNSSTTFGHANAAGAMAVAAAFWQATPAWTCDDPPNGATHDDCERNAQGQVTPQLEWFSSAGGTRIFFDVPAGNPVDELRLKPEVTGPDGANTSFFFSDSDLDADTFPNFFGTSASAPHVSAVAALMREANPALTPDEIYATLEDTALNMNPRPEGDPEQPEGFDFDTGWGFVQADLAVAAAGGGGDARPSVSLTAPADDATVSGSVEVTADASDDNGVAQVAFLLNGMLMATDTDGSDGWSTSWGTTTASEGTHTLTATATDTAGKTASDSVGVTVDNVDDPPSVNVTTPADGATVSGSVTIKADASDDRGVNQVEFFLDDTTSLGVDTDGNDGWSASWNSTAVSDGSSHTIKAIATDTDSKTASHSIIVTADNSAPANDPPVASFDVAQNPCPFDASSNAWVCQFDNTSSDPDDGVPTDSYVWDYGDGTWQDTVWDPALVLYEAEKTPRGIYTVTLTVTDIDDASDSTSTDIELRQNAHVRDLDGTATEQPRNRWQAQVDIVVLDDGGNAVPDARVDGSWSGDATASATCDTNASGLCQVALGELKSNVSSVTFTVDNVSGNQLDYTGANSDPDGDSDGTTITVLAPGASTNNAPTVSIASPTDGEIFTSGTSISFSGSAGDDEDGDLTADLVWTSNLDGQIGTGGSFSAALQDGSHTITAAVTDSGGAEGSDVISITVGSGTGSGGITLTATGRKEKGEHVIDLNWGGITEGNVDIWRNGGFVTSVPNGNNGDGSYPDFTGNKGGGSYDYQVCKQDRTAAADCSNTETVVF